MPSWEDIINQVVIPGDPQRIRDAAATWSVVFAGIAATRDTLQAGLRGLEGWEGEAADAYRTHITGLCTQLDQLQEHYSSVQHLLESAAGSLETAIANIEIPAEMAHFIDQAKQGFLDHRSLAGLGPDALYNMAGPIYNNRMASVMSTLTPDAIQDGVSKLRDAFSDDADLANSKPLGLTTAPTAGATGLDPLDHDNPNPWNSGGSDWDPTTTGLAGVDGGVLGSLGGASASLGSLGTGGGLGGLGSGSGPGLGVGLGAPGTRAGGITPGTTAGRSGAAGAGRGGMGAPGTGGSGAGGDRPERRTWLTEAEDIWGDDSEQLLPGVLGRVEQPEPKSESESEQTPEKATE